MKTKSVCLACCTIIYASACPAKAEVEWHNINQGEKSHKTTIWEEVPDAEKISETDAIKWSYIEESGREYTNEIDRKSKLIRPENLSIGEINELISNLGPSNDDFYPTTRITPFLPTAEVIPDQTWSISLSLIHI